SNHFGHSRGVGPAGIPARADRPYRLVRDDQPGRLEVRRRVAGESAAELPVDHGSRPPRLAFVELFADAQDRPQPRFDGPPELAGDPLVGLAMVAPPLAVADDPPGA